LTECDQLRETWIYIPAELCHVRVIGALMFFPDNYIMKEFIPSYSIGHFINEPANPTERYIDSNNERSTSKKQLIIYKKFQSLLADHFAENKNADFYASHLNMTQHHLNTVIKNITGKTTTQVIRARNILEAKRLLTFSDHTVSEIAATLNFFDGSYFTKLFKMETGMTPVAFKSTISGKYQKS